MVPFLIKYLQVRIQIQTGSLNCKQRRLQSVTLHLNFLTLRECFKEWEYNSNFQAWRLNYTWSKRRETALWQAWHSIAKWNSFGTFTLCLDGCYILFHNTCYCIVLCCVVLYCICIASMNSTLGLSVTFSVVT